MASKSFKSSRSNVSTASDVLDSQYGKPPLPPHVTFARRTSSGRYISYSRDDLDSELSSSEFLNYTVHMPPTPDNQPSNPVSQKVEEQYVSNSLFTGGFSSMTRAHLMDKVIDSESNHPQMAGAKGSSCAVNGCDGKVMRDERGNDILPCECDFKICRDCYIDVLKTGDGICPGCKEQYKTTDLDEVMDNWRSLPQLPPPSGMSKLERRLSLMKSTKSALMRSQTADFDHNRWLFETKGTYGYGNAFWPKDSGFENDKDDDIGEPSGFMNKPWRPLTQKLKIPAAIISPYRLELKGNECILGEFLEFKGKKDDIQSLRDIRRSKVSRVAVQKITHSTVQLLYAPRDYRIERPSRSSQWKELTVKLCTEVVFQPQKSTKVHKYKLSSVLFLSLSA